MSIYVIGACNIDIVARANKELIKRDSNIGHLSLNIGGVGHNVAKNILNLAGEVYFISKFGSDYFGDVAYDTSFKEGFNLKYAKRVEGRQSIYMAILDHTGDMYLGINDMEIVETMTYDDLKDLKKVISDEDYLMVDNNLNEDLIYRIFKEFKGIKFTDAISVSKVNKLKKSLAYIDILKLNFYEAEALVGYSLNDEKTIYKALKELMSKGTKKILLTDKDGLYLAFDDKVYRYLHNETKEEIVNATGAGDALLGAYISALSSKRSEDEAVAIALVASLITIEDEKTVSDLSIDLIEKRKKNIEGVELCYLG